MSASAYSEEDIKKRLELTIFVGFDKQEGQESKEHIPEKLLYHQLVSEEKVKSTTSSSMLKKQSKEDDSDDKQQDQKKEQQQQQSDQKKEQRCICLTINKKMKMRIHSLKQIVPAKDVYFSVKKSWNLDDIKSIESVTVPLSIQKIIIYIHSSFSKVS